MAFDPLHPTFYGECYPCDRAADVAGSAIARLDDTDYAGGRGLIYYYDPELGPATFDAYGGDSFLVRVQLFTQGLLRITDEAEFTVVVEVESGSGGTFEVRAGSDPNFGMDSPDLASEGLGTFTVDGKQRVLARSRTAFTVPLFVNRDALPLIFVRVLSGIVRIRQIRVRAWPPGGVSGDWTGAPGFEQVKPPQMMRSTGNKAVNSTGAPDQALHSPGPVAHVPGPGKFGGFDDNGDVAASFQQMTTALAAKGLPPYQSFSWPAIDGTTLTGSLRWFHASDTQDWTGNYQQAMVLLAFRPDTVTSLPNRTTFYHPDMIPWEPNAGVRDGATGGPLLSHFGGWAVLPYVEPGGVNSDLIGVRVDGRDAEPFWDQHDSPVFDSDSWFTRGGIGSSVGMHVGDGVVELVLPNVPVVVIEVSPFASFVSPGTFEGVVFQSAIGQDVALADRTVTFTGTRVKHLFSNVQVFDPSLPPPPVEATRRPRFFVTYTEVDDDPRDVSHVVGIGKPADDLSVFRVPTPLGTLRELRHGEKVTDVSVAYPLKVKLEDGSWTVVAGMTPDD